MKFNTFFIGGGAFRNSSDGFRERASWNRFDLNSSWVEGLTNAIHRVVENHFAAIDEEDAVAELLGLMEHMRREDDGSSLRVPIGNDSVEQFGIDRVQS